MGRLPLAASIQPRSKGESESSTCGWILGATNPRRLNFLVFQGRRNWLEFVPSAWRVSFGLRLWRDWTVLCDFHARKFCGSFENFSTTPFTCAKVHFFHAAASFAKKTMRVPSGSSSRRHIIFVHPPCCKEHQRQTDCGKGRKGG